MFWQRDNNQFLNMIRLAFGINLGNTWQIFILFYGIQCCRDAILKLITADLHFDPFLAVFLSFLNLFLLAFALNNFWLLVPFECSDQSFDFVFVAKDVDRCLLFQPKQIS